MYVDGYLAGRYGETHKISALETMQFSAVSVIPDIDRCLSMDCKIAGDRVYVIGLTRSELGGSEYYAVLTYWENEQAFVAWTESEDFRRAHASRPPKEMFAVPNVFEMHEVIQVAERVTSK